MIMAEDGGLNVQVISRKQRGRGNEKRGWVDICVYVERLSSHSSLHLIDILEFSFHGLDLGVLLFQILVQAISLTHKLYKKKHKSFASP